MDTLPQPSSLVCPHPLCPRLCPQAFPSDLGPLRFIAPLGQHTALITSSKSLAQHSRPCQLAFCLSPPHRSPALFDASGWLLTVPKLPCTVIPPCLSSPCLCRECPLPHPPVTNIHVTSLSLASNPSLKIRSELLGLALATFLPPCLPWPMCHAGLGVAQVDTHLPGLLGGSHEIILVHT